MSSSGQQHFSHHYHHHHQYSHEKTKEWWKTSLNLIFIWYYYCVSAGNGTHCYKLIQIVLHQATQLLFHVTVFNLNSLDTDYSLRTNHKWKWELVRSRRHPDGRSQSRVILVLALPPPDRAGPVDMDILDCLQQEAKMSICSGLWDW